MGTEAATLRARLLLVSNDPARIGVTEEALEGDRDFVRRGVSLDQVLRGIRLGHSLMAHGFLDAAAALVEEPLRTAEMKDRKRVVLGKSVSVRVDLGGRRNLKKTTLMSQYTNKLL